MSILIFSCSRYHFRSESIPAMRRVLRDEANGGQKFRDSLPGQNRDIKIFDSSLASSQVFPFNFDL